MLLFQIIEKSGIELVQVINMISRAGLVMFIVCIVVLVFICMYLWKTKNDPNDISTRFVTITIAIAAVCLLNMFTYFFVHDAFTEGRWSEPQYDVYAMAEYYDATTRTFPRCDTAVPNNPYIIHYKGLGQEQWVLYEPEPDTQAQFLNTTEE